MKQKTFILPAIWASYLINNDASGMSGEEVSECDFFCSNNGIVSQAVDCGEEYFSWHSDVKNLGGNVCQYTFLIK